MHLKIIIIITTTISRNTNSSNNSQVIRISLTKIESMRSNHMTSWFKETRITLMTLIIIFSHKKNMKTCKKQNDFSGFSMKVFCFLLLFSFYSTSDSIADLQAIKYCFKCGTLKPPRAHHCKICNRQLKNNQIPKTKFKKSLGFCEIKLTSFS